MDQVWDRIEAWLAANAPAVAAGLNPPASARELTETEEFLGVKFPDAVRASYLRHNGQSPDSPWMLEGWEWLSLKGVREMWEMWKDKLDRGDFVGVHSDPDSKAVRDDWWNPAWIPLTDSGASDHHCLDFAPGPEGTPGQIIKTWCQDGSRPVLADSFQEWLTDIADGLEAGEFVASDKYQVLCRRRELRSAE
jgi:cell wall assembly regulator SMI1